MATKSRPRRSTKKKVDAHELGRRVGRLVDVLRKQPHQTITLADVAGVTEVLIASLDRYMGSIDTSLYRECQSLHNHITEARTEIAALMPQELTKTKIPRAGQELDAIVKATEEATSEIMGAAEEMMGADDSDGTALKTTVEACCMRIFEACAFQDITGQRIAKVVSTLSYIEERLANLQRAWGDEAVEASQPEAPAAADAILLNGPALEGEGINQSDVDALMNGAGRASNGAGHTNGAAAPSAAAAMGADIEPAPLPADLEAKIDALFR